MRCGHGKFHFLRNVAEAPRGVASDPLLQVHVALSGIMEIHDGFVQRRSIVIGKKLLKIPEGLPRIGKDLQIVGNIIGQSTLNKIVDPPAFPLAVDPISLSLVSSVEMEDLPLRISSAFGNLLAEMVGDRKDIFHHLIYVGKDVSIDGLYGIAFSRNLHVVGLIDVSRSDVADRLNGTADAEASQNLCQFLFQNEFPLFLFRICRIVKIPFLIGVGR